MKTNKMAKQKTVYRCNNCGYKAVKWVGKCPSCGEWNSLIEEIERKESARSARTVSGGLERHLHNLSSEQSESEKRFTCGLNEFDRVLGNGIVEGSVNLIAGEPGIGKSTLLLQVALKLKAKKILYISGEESDHQIRMRSRRIGGESDHIQLLTESSFDMVEDAFEKVSPDFVIVDSIQTLHRPEIESSPGSVVQIRECTNALTRMAKNNNCPVMLVGHITKDGYVAGPKVLEHMVDVVLYFEGDRNFHHRVLRARKNRFGSTNEIGIFEMNESGLAEVQNPSGLLIENYTEGLSGVAVSAALEGNRPVLTEVQALVSASQYGNPQRSATGFDAKRLSMLVAVLEKRCGLPFGKFDVFLNIAGGLKINDPGVDLAVCAALASSYFDEALPSGAVFTAEVSLSGELRPGVQNQRRISECDRLGFKRFYCSSRRLTEKTGNDKIKILAQDTLAALIKSLFS